MYWLLIALCSLPLPVGERLVYDAYFGPFRIGTAILEVKGVEEVEGSVCYTLYSTQGTVGFWKGVFYMESEVYSWVDTASLATIKMIRNVREKRAVRTDTLVVRYTEEKCGVDSSKQNFYVVYSREPAYGSLGLLYWIRFSPLRPCTVMTVSKYGLGYVALEVKECGDDTVIVPRAVRDTHAKGVFEIWFGEDKMPRTLVGKMGFGTLRLMLREAE